MLYRVAFEGTNLIKMSLVVASAMLAICLLALAETTNTAEAKDSLPKNGKLAFAGLPSLRALQTTFNWEIYTVNADGSDLLRLTNNTARDTEPAWSPDGTKIAFTSTRAVGFDIFIMDADGGNVTRLTHNSGSSANPSWSPDGSKVAFERWGGEPSPSARGFETFEIYTMNVDGTGEKALTNNRGYDGLPDWSPDGRRIVYVSDGVFIMNADGTEQSQLADGGDPAWSPDGKKILLFSESDNEITAINPDGSGLTYITRAPHLVDFSKFDWQPLPRAVHPPDTGGPSLLLVAIALLFSCGVMFYAGLKRRV